MPSIIDTEPTSTPDTVRGGVSASDDERDERDVRRLDPAGEGWLLRERRQKAIVEFVWSRWSDHDEDLASRHAQWRANVWRRDGLTGVVVTRGGGYGASSGGGWSVYAPPGNARLAPAFNMAARMCRNLKSTVWVDPPVAEAVPGQAGDDDALNAAEFAGRFLRAQDSSAPLHLNTRFRLAFDIASSTESGFLIFDVMPRGGGHRPVEIQASVHATTVDEATHTVGVDPVTGEEMRIPQQGPIVTRYVAPDGSTLVDEPQKADRQWLPAMRATPLTGYQVRPTVKTAGDIDDAEGVIVARYQTLGALRERYPEGIAALSFSELRKIVEFKPEHHTRYLPRGVRELRPLTKEDLARRYSRYARPDSEGADEGTESDLTSPDPVSITGMLRRGARDSGLGRDDNSDDVSGEERDPLDIPDDVHVFTLELIQAGHTPGYPWGAEVVIAGGPGPEGRVLARGENAASKPDDRGEERKEALLIRVAQCKQFDAGDTDFYGTGAMTLLGSGNEARSTFVMSLVEHLDRFNRRKVFYSPYSLFNAKSGAAPTGTYVPVMDRSIPKAEEIPDFPKAGIEMFGFATSELQDEIGMSPVSQGKTDPSVKSAIHAATVIEQTTVLLSDVKQHAERFILRSWRIVLQQAWAHYNVSQTLNYFGEDQSYKAQDFLGTDIGGTRDVRILRGSFTMLAPSAKLQVAEYLLQLGSLEADEMRRIVGGSMGADLAIQDNPGLLRVKRQLEEFWHGPGADWVPPVPEGVDPDTGEPIPAQPASFDPFRPLPVDDEPALMTPVTAASEQGGTAAKQAGVPPAPLGGQAMLRLKELGRAMCSDRFERMMDRSEQHAAWCQMLIAAYERAKLATGTMTFPEQQQAMQAQQQAEQQAMQQQQEMEMQARQQELEMKRAEHELEMESAQAKAGMEQSAMAQKLQSEQQRSEIALQGEAQQLQLDARRGEQDVQLAAQKGALGLQLTEEQGKARARAAALQPKPKGEPR